MRRYTYQQHGKGCPDVAWLGGYQNPKRALQEACCEWRVQRQTWSQNIPHRRMVIILHLQPIQIVCQVADATCYVCGDNQTAHLISNFKDFNIEYPNYTNLNSRQFIIRLYHDFMWSCVDLRFIYIHKNRYNTNLVWRSHKWARVRCFRIAYTSLCFVIWFGIWSFFGNSH